MDCITIKNLRFRGFHGYFEEERTEGNDFEVDILLSVPSPTAPRNDDLSQTIDYSEVAGMVQRVMDGTSVKLLETLLYNIGEALVSTYPQAQKVEVAVRKLAPPMSPACEYTELRSQWPKS